MTTYTIPTWRIEYLRKDYALAMSFATQYRKEAVNPPDWFLSSFPSEEEMAVFCRGKRKSSAQYLDVAGKLRKSLAKHKREGR